MDYTFDGPNKKIQLTAGTTVVDVDDMYSRWVDWLLTSDNSKYLLAMRNVGGDPISDVKNLGITYFLTNGWRIVPQSADHRLVITGNLVTDPSGYSPIDTVMGYSIIVEYSVSNLVDTIVSEDVELDDILASIGVALLDDQNVEVGLTLRNALRLIAAATSGLLSGATGGTEDETILIKNAVANSKTRIQTLDDQYGNRKQIQYDLTD